MNGVRRENQEVGMFGYPGGTYKDVRNFEHDLEEVKAGDTVELETPMVVNDQQPSTSSAQGVAPTGTLSASASKPRRAKKSRTRHHSSGHVNGNDQLVIVEPLQDN